MRLRGRTADPIDESNYTPVGAEYSVGVGSARSPCTPWPDDYRAAVMLAVLVGVELEE